MGKFLELVQDCYLIQHVLVPISGSNTLDLVLTSEPAKVNKLDIKEHFSNSDHNVITFELVCKISVTEIARVNYAFNKAMRGEMRKDLINISWVDSIGKNFKSTWRKFYGILLEKII